MKNADFSTAQPGPDPWPFMFIALFIIWGVGYETLWDRLTTEMDGMVVSRQYLPRTAWQHGWGMRYLIRESGGTTQEYVAGPTDASLSRDIPAGVRIQKREWELSYSVNGQRIDDFPRYFYTAILACAVALLFWGRHQSVKLAAWRRCRDIVPNQP